MKIELFPLIILLLIILLVSIFAVTAVNYIIKLLFPLIYLVRECRDKQYSTSFMLMFCIKKNGYFCNHRNGKCIDEDGYCAICYPKVVKHGLQVKQDNTTFGNTIFKNE